MTDQADSVDPTTRRVYKSRKFILVMYVTTLATGLLYFELIPATVWQAVTSTALLGYLAGNVTQDVLSKFATK